MEIGLSGLAAKPVDFNASWSNRNGGEILVTVGSTRMTVSAAIARIVHEKLGRALGVPVRAAAMAAREPAPEPERIARPAARMTEPLADRRASLSRTVPDRWTRLMAVREARGVAANEGVEWVHIAGIPFTSAELDGIQQGLEVD